MKKHSVSELNNLYDDGEAVDREVFTEMRSNVMLLAGDHYSKKDRDNDYRDKSARASESLKLRLVKNHVHKVVRHYGTSILANAPGVVCMPQNDTDLQDQKDADLNQAVYTQHKVDYRLKERYRQWALDFSAVGELCVFLRWNPDSGRIIGNEQAADENGQPLFDQTTGEPLPDEEKPVFEGKFEVEDIFPANLFRDSCSKSMRDSPWLGVRKTVQKKKLVERYKDDEEKIKSLSGSGKEEFVVFEPMRSSYKKTQDEVLIKEFYFRPCRQYPEGYFYIMACDTVLEEGPLPFGIFPILWGGFDEFPTSARARSIIKVIRPYIAEINRASSQLAMHQITIGDDKILYQKGSKLEQGALLPGVRGISYQGRTPEVLPGRDGSQFLAYIQAQIAEMYSVVMLSELTEEKMTQLDPMTLLYRAASQQQRYGLYAEKFEQFLIDFVTTLLEMSKNYMPDSAVIPAIGKGELINLEEFRKTTPFRYQIRLEPRSDTIDSMLGRQITFQNVLQYVGKNLDKDELGKVLQQMPWANAKEAFADFTIDDENVKNDMLAMERGQYPPIGKADNPAKMLKKLESRIRKPDYRFLDLQIQQLYDRRIQEYVELQAQQQQKILAEQSEYIPMDGPGVKCDMYTEDPNNPGASAKRAMFPQNSLGWLKKRLEAQGASLSQLGSLSPNVQADLADQRMTMNGGMPGGGTLPLPPGGPGSMPPPMAM